MSTFIIHAMSFRIHNSSSASSWDYLKHLSELNGLFHYNLKFENYALEVVTYSANPELENFESRSDFAVKVRVSSNEKSRLDRWAEVLIRKDRVSIQTDLYGSVPVWVNLENHQISNVFPAIQRSQSVDPIGLLDLLAFGHPLWANTVWTDISLLDPDTETTFTTTGSSWRATNSESLGTWRRAVNQPRRESKATKTDNFRDLNNTLVEEAFDRFEEIILPLSSGYDSRLILAAISEIPSLARKTRTFTYGPRGSIEVRSAQRLARLAGVEWHQIELDTDFLTEHYLHQTSSIFGASLHMHSMYQGRFWDHLKETDVLDSGRTCLTSGFMTGVPAGQHVGKMLKQQNQPYGGLAAFTQSSWWKRSELLELGFSANDLEDVARRISATQDLFEADEIRKTIWLDCVTRQRNFISYYPRFFEWKIPVVSPHCNEEYLNFMLSLPDHRLKNRVFVEEFLSKHYPDLNKVPSDSNLFGRKGSRIGTLFLLSRLLMGRLGETISPLKSLGIPEITFDEDAIKNPLNDPLFGLIEEKLIPLLSNSLDSEKLSAKITADRLLVEKGDLAAYYRQISFQALSLDASRSESLF